MKPPTRVDPATHRLFISRGTHFMVVDLAQGKIVGDIPETQGAHGVAFAAEFNRCYTTNGRTADSTIFDMATLKVLGNVKTDKDTDGVIYDPFSKRVFTFNGDANTATAPTVWDPHRRCLMERTRYHPVSLNLQLGDVVALVSDGILECQNAEDEAFGARRLAAVLT